MIERTVIDGVGARVTYLKGDMQPCTQAECTMIKVYFDDGRVVFAFPSVTVGDDFDPDQPRDEDGKWTNGAETLFKAPKDRDSWPAHAKSLAVPPGWSDVQINRDPQAALQATGRDGKGRSVYIYSAEFQAAQSAAKFARISELATKADEIAKQNEAARKSSDPVIRDHADVTALIMKMGLRPGGDGDTKAAVQAYGATTLLGSHVHVDGNATRLRFVGKKGVNLDLEVEDKSLAKMLRSRAAEAGDGKLFPNIDSSSLLDYTHSLDGGNFKTKDFRTYLGTSTAARLVATTPEPTDAASYKKAVLGVAKIVSSKLGNTPTVALQSYIDPRVFAPWRRHGTT